MQLANPRQCEVHLLGRSLELNLVDFDAGTVLKAQIDALKVRSQTQREPALSYSFLRTSPTFLHLFFSVFERFFHLVFSSFLLAI